MAGNTVRTYRNLITGVVAEHPESLAEVFDYLELVDENAKTLINPPQSEETRAGHDAHMAAKAESDPAEEAAE